MEKGQYLYNISGHKLTLKLTGPLTYLNSVAFDSFISRIFEKEPPEEIFIDLSETTGIDSTNLGLLARIGEESISGHGFRTAILSTSPDISRTLESMGFDAVFRIIDNSPNTKGALKKIPERHSSNEQELAGTILEAHKQLMAMNKENENTFRSVVEFMEKDIKKHKK